VAAEYSVAKRGPRKRRLGKVAATLLSMFDDAPASAPHGSGPMWVASPHSYDFYIHYNLAGLTGAQETNR
jgi:hypothetical protein